MATLLVSVYLWLTIISYRLGDVADIIERRATPYEVWAEHYIELAQEFIGEVI